MDLKKAYIVYPGLGKSTLSAQREEFADLQTKVFKDLSLAKYIGRDDYPNYRGNEIKELNPDFPNNRNVFAKKLLDAGKILLMVPKQDSYDLLSVLGITDFLFVLPDKDRLFQLERDYKGRGDNAKYIVRNTSERYQSALDDAKRLGKEIIFLRPGEYLSDVFKDSRVKDDKLPRMGKTAGEIVRGIYRHYKGNLYEVLYVGRHSETLEDVVVYKALYGENEVWVRPAIMWNEIVEVDGKKIKRFDLIEKL